jgi:hypothetical protein
VDHCSSHSSVSWTRPARRSAGPGGVLLHHKLELRRFVLRLQAAAGRENAPAAGDEKARFGGETASSRASSGHGSRRSAMKMTPVGGAHPNSVLGGMLVRAAAAEAS